MRFNWLKFMAVLVVFVLGAIAVIPSQAAGGASISISYAPTGQAPSSCDEVEIDYHFIIPDANTDDGGGVDWFAIATVDGKGNFVDTDFESESLGSVDDTDSFDGFDPATITTRPLTFSLYDITAPGVIDENTDAGHNFAASGTLLAQTTIDPGTLTTNGTCDALPLIGGVCVPIPAGSVVGDTPYQVQVYWAPGKVSPGVFLNPGTYWVIGEDDTHQYYKILLSCDYVWVPVQDFQPSYQAPQNGAPLPTTVVN